MKYYIIAGEASGDLHGSNLIKGLKKADPKATFKYWGGDLMEQVAGAPPVKHYKESSIMGFVEVLLNIRRIARFMRECRQDIASFKPDVLILIDYPGFNLRMAKFAKSIGITTHYYIAPKVWAWKEGRVKKIQKYVDKLFVIFPFEIEYFRKFGIEAYYAGNPLMDSIAARGTSTLERFSSENGLSGKPIVALVAGSRAHEINFNLPPMVEVSRVLPEYQFVVTGVSWLDKKLYDKHLAGTDVKYVCDKTYETLSVSSAALVTSGTATLETALLQVPQVVCFRGPAVTMWIAARLVKIKWISLVNLVMNRTVVNELIQQGFTSERALEELEAVLPDGKRHQKLMQDYTELSAAIGGSGASERVAQEIYRELKDKD